MKKEITTAIIINATPNKVWEILTAFSQYPEWNPFIRSINGDIKPGSKITVRIKQPDSKAMTFKPTVLAYETNNEFRWLGSLWFKGLFDGEHCFQLKDNGDGTTTFIQSEKFRGILVRLLSKMIETTTKAGFELMNTKLKERAEL